MEFSKYSANPNFPEVHDVDPQDILAHKSNLVLIDVRRADEFSGELGHIPGSQLLTLDQLPAKLDTLPKNKTIVFVCRSGARSAQAAAFAMENGFTEVYNMKGGMILWNEYGLTTEK